MFSGYSASLIKAEYVIREILIYPLYGSKIVAKKRKLLLMRKNQTKDNFLENHLNVPFTSTSSEWLEIEVYYKISSPSLVKAFVMIQIRQFRSETLFDFFCMAHVEVKLSYGLGLLGHPFVLKIRTLTNRSTICASISYRITTINIWKCL